MTSRRSNLILIAFVVALPLALVFATSVGMVNVGLEANLAYIAQKMGLGAESSVAHQQILAILRWPRTLMAALIGACLALSGAVMQGLFRNPLADPSIVGVSGGAAVGAACAIVAGVPLATWFENHLGHIGFLANTFTSTTLVSLCAFVGGFASAVTVYVLGSNRMGRTSVGTMLLAGIAINALAAAVTGALAYLASDVALRRISVWQMGSFDGANASQLLVAMVFIFPLLFLLCRYAKPLNTLLLGESEARHLGVPVDKLKWRLIALSSLGIGVAVALAGVIGFVGLVVFHIVRMLVGADHRVVLPASALLGAILMVLGDVFSRSLMAPAEVPIGIVTALTGVPFFLFLLIRQRQRLASDGL